MRAREVYERLHGRTEQPLLDVLLAMAERQSVQQQEIDALGMAFDKIAHLVDQMVRVGENMRAKLEKLRGGEDSSPLTGTGILSIKK